ncbi:MAG: hypothetical protein LQ337_003514 [Flavoplaca oasis]|nr:MAG: hypothetical protein LQ337_003514 [Flavoplaca oasis]
MHLGLLPIALLLTWSLPFAHADGLNQKFESATTNRSLASTFNNNCSQQIEDKNNPICLHPGPPRDPLVHSYTVSDPDNPWMRPFSFHLTVPRTLTAATWAKVQIANLRSTLPSILTQLGVDPSQVAALVSEGIPLVVAANDAIHSKRSILSPPSNFARREPTSNIRSWVRKVGTSIARPVRERVHDLECFIFSAVIIPAYISSAWTLSVLHPAANGEETTADQDFFINALYGISHDRAVRVHYSARIPNDIAAVTYGNRIYTSAHRSSKLARRPLLRDRFFQQSTKLLLHEFAHVMQFRAFDHSIPASGWAYLKGYCNAGYSYFRNPYEVEAFEKQEQVNELLEDPIGTQFMDLWKTNFWATTLGLPIRRNYIRSPIRPGQFALPFQNGRATLDCKPSGECAGTAEVRQVDDSGVERGATSTE